MSHEEKKGVKKNKTAKTGNITPDKMLTRKTRKIGIHIFRF